MYKILLLFLILSLAESIFLPLPATLLVIIGYGVLSEQNTFPVAFIAGLFLDFATGRTIGIDSLIFLTIVYIISLYRRKIMTQTLLYILPFSALIIIVYNYIFMKRLDIWAILFSLIAGSLIFIFVSAYVKKSDKRHKLSY